MFRRVLLTLILLATQLVPAAGRLSACAENDFDFGSEEIDLEAAHRAVCGESCCCSPDECPCMASRDTDRESPPAPAAPPVRSESAGIDLILPHGVGVRDNLHAAATSRALMPARAPMSAARLIHAVIGIWLT